VVWRLAVGIARILGRLLRGLVALTVLVTLVAALPWALWHYIGWPLPDHLPTAAEVQTVLLGPMTTAVLLEVLACLCWITWAAFVIDVTRCVLDAAQGLRWPDLDTSGPVHALAAVLVGVIVVALLSNRGPSTITAGITEAISGHGPLVATAPVANPTPAHIRPVAMVHATPTAVAPQDAGSVMVRAPENGIHDSLSRIAARTLGTAGRWPEIFALNEGKPQPHGGRLTNPNLIFPGERLTLPLLTSPLPAAVIGADHHAAPPTMVIPTPRLTPTTSPSPAPAPPMTLAPPLPPTTAPRVIPVPAVVPMPQIDTTGGSGSGVEGEPGVFVGLGLAVAISAALVAARRRHQRRYQPGSGRRDDLPVAPVVYQLRLAHLRADHADTGPEGDLDDGEHHRCGGAAPALVIGAPPDPRRNPDRAGEEMRVTPGLGVRDGREIALDLAVARGLGLVGVGACAAARALLLTLLAPPPVTAATVRSAVGTQVIVPVNDLALLLGPEHAHHQWPAAVRVVADLDAALDELEAELLRRVRDNDPAAGAWPVVTLVARPPEHITQRLQAVLDNGAPLGLVGVLLGQWRPGISAYIRDGGIVSSASPGHGHALLGTRMFQLPEARTAELLTLLRQAQPEPPNSPTPRDHAAQLTPLAHQGKGTPLTPAQPPVDNASSTTLDARDGACEVIDDTALELTALPSPQPEHIGAWCVPGPAPHPASEPPRPCADAQGSHPHHPPGGELARRRATAALCCPVAPEESDPHDACALSITLSVLGRPRVHWTPHRTGEAGEGGGAADAAPREITSAFPPRQRELLVFLALHPDGVHRDPLVAALWEDNASQRSTNALNTALSRLRRSVNQATGGAVTDFITVTQGRYQLDTGLVEVDYWRWRDAVAARLAAERDTERIAAYQQIVDCYRGCLAEGMDTEWIDAPREATRRDALDAVAALARALVDADPQRTLDLLETARAFDPHNELLYRDIMRLQQQLGHLDAIPRTITLLTTRLTEIDETPTTQILELAARLQQRSRDTATVR
jgi:DNA-binding SARP family transcriptional activator